MARRGLGVRAAVRRDLGGCGARRSVLRLGQPRAAAGSGRDRVHPDLGCRGGRCRCGRGVLGGSALPILPVVLVLLMIGGAADMASSAFRQSIMLAAANDEVRGRLQGVFLVVVAGGPRIADVAHGAAAASVGVA